MRIRKNPAAFAACVITALLLVTDFICIANLIKFSTLEYYAGMTMENASYVGLYNYADIFKTMGAARMLFNDAVLCALKILFSGAYVFWGAYIIGNIKNSFTRGAAVSIIAAPVFAAPAVCV